VTGCTDGIGKEFALQLAQKGFNLVLVSRTRAKLDALAEQIKTDFGVETKIVAFDFSTATDVDFAAFKQVADSVQVGLLVNNAGMGYEYPESFSVAGDDADTAIINVNVVSLIRITKAVLPQMIARKNGLVINVSSISGISPTPLLAVYSGTKAFVTYFSQCLGTELAESNVLVENLIPGYVVSKLSKTRKSFMSPNADEYVRCVLNKIGIPGGADAPFCSTPYPSHALLQWFMSMLGRKLLLRLTLDQLVAVRAKAIRKKEKEASKTE